jgi:hypothetical protein
MKSKMSRYFSKGCATAFVAFTFLALLHMPMAASLNGQGANNVHVTGFITTDGSIRALQPDAIQSWHLTGEYCLIVSPPSGCPTFLRIRLEPDRHLDTLFIIHNIDESDF